MNEHPELNKQVSDCCGFEVVRGIHDMWYCFKCDKVCTPIPSHQQEAAGKAEDYGKAFDAMFSDSMKALDKLADDILGKDSPQRLPMGEQEAGGEWEEEFDDKFVFVPPWEPSANGGLIGRPHEWKGGVTIGSVKSFIRSKLIEEHRRGYEDGLKGRAEDTKE